MSSGLLLIFGVGSIAGPLISGLAMSAMGPRGLFVATLGAHVITISFMLWRMTRRQAVGPQRKIGICHHLTGAHFDTGNRCLQCFRRGRLIRSGRAGQSVIGGRLVSRLARK